MASWWFVAPLEGESDGIEVLFTVYDQLFESIAAGDVTNGLEVFTSGGAHLWGTRLQSKYYPNYAYNFTIGREIKRLGVSQTYGNYK